VRRSLALKALSAASGWEPTSAKPEYSQKSAITLYRLGACHILSGNPEAPGEAFRQVLLLL